MANSRHQQRAEEMREAERLARCPHCGGDLSKWEHPVAVLVIKRESERAQADNSTLDKALARSYEDGQAEGYRAARQEQRARLEFER